jgi:ankyrin repeat protein
MMRNNQPRKMPRDLAKAVKTNDVVQVSHILTDKKYQDPAWLNAVNSRGRTALQLALKYNCFNVAGLLLNHNGIDLKVIDRYGKTLLDLSVGDADIFLRILNDANSPALTNSAAIKAVNLAIDNNRLDVFKALIARKINVNAIVYDEDTILKLAVQKCRTEFVRLLLEQPGIDVNTSHPLVEAAYQKHVEILTLLVNHPGINVNLSNTVIKPIDAVHFMSGLGSNQHGGALPCLKALLSHPAIEKKWLNNNDDFMKWLLVTNPNLFRKILNLPSTTIEAKYYQSSSDHYFEINCNHLDAINVLISDPDFDINMLTWDGHTLLTKAIDQRNDGVVNSLLNCPRIDLHRQDKFGHTALTQADEAGRKDLVTAIMQHPRFNLLATYQHKQNLLMLAAKMDCAHLVRIVLQTNRFDVNAADADGNTALILLAKHHKNANDATLFTELLEHGADANQKNSHGINAIMAAKNGGLKGIAHELKNAPPRAAATAHAGATAPKLEDLDTAVAIEKAATVPPTGYYHQGLFAPEVYEQPLSSIEKDNTQTHQHRPE